MANPLRLEVLLSAIDRATGPLKRIAGGAAGASQALAQSKKALAALDRTSKDISGLAKTRAALRANDAQLAQSNARQTALRAQLDATRASHHALAGEVKAGRAAFAQQAAAFQALKAPSAEVAASYRAQEQALAKLEARYSKSTAALRQEKNALKGADTEVRQLSARKAELSTRLTETRQKLEAAGITTDRLASRQRELRREVRQASEALAQQALRAQALQRAHATAEGMKQGGMSRFAQGTSMAFSGYGAMRVSALPVAQAMQFESAMADVRKVVDFDTPAQFREMSQDIQQLSRRLPMTSEGIAALVAAAGQASIPRQELLRFAEDAAKMGVAFDATAEEAGQTMATWRTAFRLDQTGVVRLADQINYLGNTGPANVAKISAVVNRIGSLGEVAGVQSGPLAALGATIAGMGVQEEVAATGIKNMMLRLTAGEAATKRQRVALKALGLDAVKVSKAMQVDANGTILDVLTRIQKLPRDVQTSNLSLLFGTESVGAIAPLLTNLDLLKDNLSKVADAQRYGGSMSAEYASRAATTANRMQLMKNSAAVAAQQLGTVLLPAATAVFDRVGALAGRLADWAEANPKLAATLGKLAIVGAAVFTVLGVGLMILGLLSMSLGHTIALFVRLGPMASKAGALVGRALMGIGRFAMVAGRMMLASPLGLAIALLAGAAYLVWRNWEGIKGGAILLWQDIGNAVSGVWQYLQARGAALGEALRTIFGWTPLGMIVSNWTQITAFLGGMWARFKDIGGNLMQGLVDGITAKWAAVKKAVGGIADSVAGWFKAPLQIRSPSRVFAALGGDTMAGYTQGLLGGQRGAQDALQRIGRVMRATGAGMALGAAGAATAGEPLRLDGRPPIGMSGKAGAAPTVVYEGDRNYNITINAPGGTAAADIARVVRAELERLESDKRAGRRASLSDYD
jgi:TP901 family phage tail tape measure protein